MSALMRHNDITEVSIPKILQKAIAVIDINIHNALCVNKEYNAEWMLLYAVAIYTTAIYN